MGHAAIDILKYEEDLKALGVPDKQAALHAKHSAEMISNNLTTKDDLSAAIKDLKIWMGGFAVTIISVLSIVIALVHK